MGDFNQDIKDNEIFPSSSEFKASAQVQKEGKMAYAPLYKQSIEKPGKFWGNVAKELYFKKPPKEKDVGPKFSFDHTKGVNIEWFKGSTTNLCYNCLDRWQEWHQKTAFFYRCNDPDDKKSTFYTFHVMFEMVCKMANALKGPGGVKKGDVVTIYMPMVAELPAAMLACARLGAMYSVVFGGFSAESLAQRIVDANSEVLVTSDGVMRGDKCIQLKGIANAAMQQAFEAKQKAAIRCCIVHRRLTGTDKEDRLTCGPMKEQRDEWWDELCGKQAKECPVEWMDAEAPLFMLYTSGSTGKPKGVVHSTAGYMVGAYASYKYTFDCEQSNVRDVFFCTADCGWITGHTYGAYGPLMNFASQVLYEGVPTWPGVDALWEICAHYKVTILYTAPTVIRALMKSGEDPVKKHDLSSLRLLGSVGEPINPEAWKWYHRVVGGGKCPIADTYWQTETGSHLITPLCGAHDQKPGSAGFPFFGVELAILDEKGNELKGEAQGALVLKKPPPSMMRTVYGDHKRFQETYFSQFKGYYFTGDGCRRDKDGYYWLTGRMDDVINISGHRIGTAEVESALVAFDKVAEAAVVGYPHDVKGEGIWAYVTLKEGEAYDDSLKPALKAKVRDVIGAFATPDEIHWAPALPKTRSGKIMRRILRKLALPDYETQDLGDTSTLADPSAVDTLKDRHPRKPAPPEVIPPEVKEEKTVEEEKKAEQAPEEGASEAKPDPVVTETPATGPSSCCSIFG